MKTYNIKYEINQEVYILTDNKIYQSKIQKIRVTESIPWINGNDHFKHMDGIEIKYLVVTSDEEYVDGDPRSHRMGFNWYKQDDVFATKEELIQNIK
jgi:hypothetical protein